MNNRGLKVIHIAAHSIRYPLATALGYYFGPGTEMGMWILVALLTVTNMAVDSLYWVIFKGAEK